MSADETSPQDTLLRMTNAFQVSQAIYVAATFGFADLLEDGPKSTEELAETTGTHAPSLYRLLRALASIGIFIETEGRFGLTPLAQYLRTDTPGSLRAFVRLIGQQSFWRSWVHLLHSVRTGEPAFRKVHGTAPWEYWADHPEEDAIFKAAMTSLSSGVVDAVVRSYDFSGIGVLLDVGGGEGALLAAILAANPSLRGILFDQPHVVCSVGALLERAGVADRCEVVGGSFFEAVPAGADAYLLKSVIHDWDDDEAIEILRAGRAAMYDSGKLLVVERIIRAGVNQKGGVAKTTTVVNLGAALGAKGRTVLLIDLDPQASLSLGLGVPVHELEGTMHEVMISEAEIADIILPTGIEGVELAPAEITMTTLERQLSGQVAFDSVLDRALQGVKDQYDYVLIDCRPSLEALEINAVRAADYLIIPILAERYALYGTDQLLEFIYMVRERLKPSLEILGVLLTKVDRRNALTDQVITEVQNYPPVNKPVIEAVPCVTLFPCIIQRPEGTRPMASIEIIIRDDEGRIIGKKHYDDEEFDLGSATFHEIEGAVETLKQKPYPRSNVPC